MLRLLLLTGLLCLVDGVWQEWGQWRACSVTCGGSTHLRYRVCTPPKFGGLDCQGSGRDEKPCGEAECPDACACNPCFPGVQCRNKANESHIPICGACPIGYTGDGVQCTDVDECAERPCFNRRLCENLNGTGYRCLPCSELQQRLSYKPFYSGAGTEGRGIEEASNRSLHQKCEDVDECAENNDGCFDKCFNNLGSYRCSQCPAGYIGDGKTCDLEDACEAKVDTCDIKVSFCVSSGGGKYNCTCVDIGYLSYKNRCYQDEDLDKWPNAADEGCFGASWCTTDNCPSVPNVGQEDIDNDGLGDACDDDTDNDGVDDRMDNCPSIPNEDQTDTDGDKFGDLCDNCPLTPNRDQADLNRDGVGNACEIDPDEDGVFSLPVQLDNCPLVRNEQQSDVDRDGVGDHCDNCPLISNSDQGDSDFDSFGDVCDDNQDRDHDGLMDAVDQCPDIANPANLNHDQSHPADACDDDDDNDLVPDGLDNCPLVYNPSQEDENEDGVGDDCETDSDGDGVPDDQDTCPYYRLIDHTDFRVFTVVNVADMTQGNEPVWLVTKKAGELEQTEKSGPTIAVSRYAFRNVDFTSDLFVNSGVGDGFIGLVFGYQSSRQFYLAAWKRHSSGLYIRPFRAMLSSRPGIVIKRVDAPAQASFDLIRTGLWLHGGYFYTAKRLWYSRTPQARRGWLYKQSYRWKIESRPANGTMRLTIYEGPKLIIDSGYIQDRTGTPLMGGHLGLFSYDQAGVRFTNINYKCRDPGPR